MKKVNKRKKERLCVYLLLLYLVTIFFILITFFAFMGVNNQKYKNNNIIPNWEDGEYFTLEDEVAP